MKAPLDSGPVHRAFVLGLSSNGPTDSRFSGGYSSHILMWFYDTSMGTALRADAYRQKVT